MCIGLFRQELCELGIFHAQLCNLPGPVCRAQFHLFVFFCHVLNVVLLLDIAANYLQLTIISPNLLMCILTYHKLLRTTNCLLHHHLTASLSPSQAGSLSIAIPLVGFQSKYLPPVDCTWCIGYFLSDF